MNDVKTKLGQVDVYAFDSSQAKMRVRRRVMSAYVEKYGDSMQTASHVEFSLPRFLYVPVLATLTLVAFVSYEYLNKPLTAYAYLEKVRGEYSKSENLSIKTRHVIGGKAFEVELVKANDGDAHIKVKQGSEIFEDVVLKNNRIYVDDLTSIFSSSVSSEDNVARNLVSVVNAMVLAEVSDPRDEWEDIMSKQGVRLDIIEGGNKGLVKISYEDTNENGEHVLHEHVFRDFQPVEKRVVLRDDDKSSVVEQVAYLDVSQPTKTPILETASYAELLPSDIASVKTEDLIVKSVPELANEFTDLTSDRKLAYLDTWALPDMPVSTLKSLDEVTVTDVEVLESAQDILPTVLSNDERQLPSVSVSKTFSEEDIVSQPTIVPIALEKPTLVERSVLDVADRLPKLDLVENDEIEADVPLRDEIIYKELVPVVVENKTIILENYEKKLKDEASRDDELKMEDPKRSYSIPVDDKTVEVNSQTDVRERIDILTLPKIAPTDIVKQYDLEVKNKDVTSVIKEELENSVNIAPAPMIDNKGDFIEPKIDLPSLDEREIKIVPNDVIDFEVTPTLPKQDVNVVPLTSEPVSESERRTVIDQSYYDLVKEKEAATKLSAEVRKDTRMIKERSLIDATLNK